MPDHRLVLGFLDYSSETALFVYLLSLALRRRCCGLTGLLAYVTVSVGVGVLRLFAVAHYGALSQQYALCYWLTDFPLVFAVFLLIASFFRRACAGRVEAWRHVRLMLTLIPPLTGAVSYIAILRLRHSFFPYFVIEFQQDLYFACLVLVTMLYLMLLKFDPADEQLGLLVCGLGVMFAGFAASYALVIATRWAPLAGVLSGYIPQVSDMGMVSIWLYAAARVPKTVPAKEAQKAPKDFPAGALARI
jgi:hypothetical protein